MQIFSSTKTVISCMHNSSRSHLFILHLFYHFIFFFLYIMLILFNFTRHCAFVLPPSWVKTRYIDPISIFIQDILNHSIFLETFQFNLFTLIIPFSVEEISLDPWAYLVNQVFHEPFQIQLMLVKSELPENKIYYFNHSFTLFVNIAIQYYFVLNWEHRGLLL